MKYLLTSKLKPVGSQVVNETDGHQFISDEPVRFKGTDAGPNPVQYLLGAVGSCLGASAASIVHRNPDVEIKKFEVEVRSETKYFKDRSSKLEKIYVKIDCETNLDPIQHDDFINEVLHLCTIHNTIKDAVDFEFEIV